MPSLSALQTSDELAKMNAVMDPFPNPISLLPLRKRKVRRKAKKSAIRCRYSLKRRTDLVESARKKLTKNLDPAQKKEALKALAKADKLLRKAKNPVLAAKKKPLKPAPKLAPTLRKGEGQLVVAAASRPRRPKTPVLGNLKNVKHMKMYVKGPPGKNQIVRFGKQPQKGPIVCRRCNKTGHVAKHCPDCVCPHCGSIEAHDHMGCPLAADRTLYIATFPKDATDKEIKSQLKKVLTIRRRQGFAFVTFETPAASRIALTKGSITLQGKPCVLEKPKPTC
eukprot:NODE_3391_length_976_cov_49.070671_g3245_i0.p2 GENE.NODE_3391_length_976_cov_49.070671_g3245_i0~~NODE_3391_length_976_cov_49.070671_g3245_i0.p2  ORF type:complete len:280 (-),score=58.45 NODE_3391_length_976_cov_49.070671_g3245_i0:69-908(-)